MAALVCPSCGTGHPGSERFCPDCGLPLVHAPGVGDGTGPVSERRERLRKIKPQYSEGDLVRVTGARHQAEAEFIQGLLLEEGVPSMLRRSRGFDVPDFLAAGPRDVLVPASGAGAAREVLLEAELVEPAPTRPGPDPRRLLAGLLAGLAAVGAIAWLGGELLR